MEKNNELQESGAVSVREIQASESKYFTNLLEMIIAQQELSKLAQEASFNWETINAFNLDNTKTVTQLEIAKDHFEYMLNKQYQVHLFAPRTGILLPQNKKENEQPITHEGTTLERHQMIAKLQALILRTPWSIFRNLKLSACGWVKACIYSFPLWKT